MVQNERSQRVIWVTLLVVFCGFFGLRVPFSAEVQAQDIPITAHPSARFASQLHDRAQFSQLANRFDVTFYHLTLNLNGLRNPILLGRNRIVGRALADLDSLQFDLSNNLVVDFVSLTTGGALTYSHQDHKVTVVLKTRLLKGSKLELDLVYHGNPASTGFGAFTNIQNVPGKPNTIWTLSEPYGSKEWWPSDDQLSDKSDSVRVTVRVPAPMKVASNGLFLGKSTHMDGSSTFDWVHRYPISPYLVSLAIGEYDEYTQTYTRPDHLVSKWGVRSFPVQHFAYKGSNAFQGISPTSGWHLATEMLPVFEDWMGPYPFEKEKYVHAHVTFKGGMEHQTISSIGNIGAELIAHELAHQWFGDKLTPQSWSDLWLNEGFATMSEFLIYESDPKYASMGRILGNLYYQRARLARGTLVQQDTLDVAKLFDFSGVYAKGYMVLRMIRGIVGDDVFKQILRSYTSVPSYAYASVSTADFQRVVEEVSGRSFQTFFDQWVYSGTGLPTYDVSWSIVSEGMNPQVQIELQQIQRAGESSISVFEMPVWLEIETAGRTYRIQVVNNQRSQVYTIDLPESALRVRVDPDKWILRGDSPTHVGVDEAVTVSSDLSFSIYPNPTKGAINLHFEHNPSGESISISVYDLLGRIVRTHRTNPGWRGEMDIALDGQGLLPGVYTIRAVQNGRIRSQPVILTR